MSRHLFDPFNPGIYALLLRTGVKDRLRKRLSIDVTAMAAVQRRQARELCDAGIISAVEYDDIQWRIARKAGAAFLMAMRAEMPLAERQKLIRTIRAVAPLGLTARDIKFGRSHA